MPEDLIKQPLLVAYIYKTPDLSRKGLPPAADLTEQQHLHQASHDPVFTFTMSLAPPFTAETAHAKVKKAQDLWNTQ